MRGMNWAWLNRKIEYPPWTYRFNAYAEYFYSALFGSVAVISFLFGDHPIFRFGFATVCAIIAACSYCVARSDMKEVNRCAVNPPAPNPDSRSESN
jgi:hypothetical protein